MAEVQAFRPVSSVTVERWKYEEYFFEIIVN